MIAPQPKKPLLLYLISTPQSIGALLVQDINGVEKPVYYISHKVNGVKSRYTPIKRHCLALIFTGQKLRHYFLAHPIQVVTKSDPARYLLSKPALNGRMERWLLALAKYDNDYITPKAIKSQALANLLAQFPSGEHEPGKVPLPGEVHISATAVETYWDIKFDRASGAGKGGAGITLTSQEGKKFHLSYKLDFECSNNEVKYKVLILGLIAAQKKALCKPKIWDGSKLVVKQTLGDFALKEPLLAPYRTIVQKLLTQFDDVQIQCTPRTHNRFPDALATLWANVDIPDDSIAIVIKKRITPEVLAEEHT
ncbi:uncharacterized protein LOC114299598 [Camellia sinensis]|uniref:uncharacterized protein LOC114299598 n=1 Tax=Camellia sinensis TaxID=4442 RepID=UPI0010358622|nr:uncharacterized protein LOC114299598 [Camellia sinensis]